MSIRVVGQPEEWCRAGVPRPLFWVLLSENLLFMSSCLLGYKTVAFLSALSGEKRRILECNRIVGADAHPAIGTNYDHG